MVTYKRSQTLATLVINYKILAHRVDVEKGVSHTCGKCILCTTEAEKEEWLKNRYYKIKN